jgi:hypothetical protein
MRGGSGASGRAPCECAYLRAAAVRAGWPSTLPPWGLCGTHRAARTSRTTITVKQKKTILRSCERSRAGEREQPHPPPSTPPPRCRSASGRGELLTSASIDATGRGRAERLRPKLTPLSPTPTARASAAPGPWHAARGRPWEGPGESGGPGQGGGRAPAASALRRARQGTRSCHGGGRGLAPRAPQRSRGRPPGPLARRLHAPSRLIREAGPTRGERSPDP